MSTIIDDLFSFFGFSPITPVLFGDFMMWFVKFIVTVCIIAFVFKMFAGIVRTIAGRRLF